MYDAPEPPCATGAGEFLDADLRSGYVRILHEMIAAGWSDAEVASSVREMTSGWFVLLADVARREGERGTDLGPFTPEEIGALMGSPFIGAESMLLLGMSEEVLPARSALRRLGPCCEDHGWRTRSSRLSDRRPRGRANNRAPATRSGPGLLGVPAAASRTRSMVRAIHRSCSCHRGRSSTRELGADPGLRATASVSSPGTTWVTAAPIGRATCSSIRPARAANLGAVMDAAEVLCRVLVGLRPPARWSCSRPSNPSASSVSHSSVRRPPSARGRSVCGDQVRGASRRLTAGQRRTSISGAATTPPTSSSSSARRSRRRTPRSNARTASAGDPIPTRRAWRRPSGPR